MNRAVKTIALIVVLHVALGTVYSRGTGETAQQPVTQSSKSSQPPDLIIPPANASGQADWFSTEQELTNNSRSIQPDGSFYPLPNPIEIARDLKPVAATVFGGQTLPTFRVPFNLLNVDAVMEKVLRRGTNASPDAKNTVPKVKMTWRPRIYGVAHQQFFQNGCSDIPLCEDYSVLLRYEIAVDAERIDPTGKTITSTPLGLDVDDPTPVYMRTRCWKKGTPHSVAVFERQARGGADISERLNSVHDSLEKWLTKNVDDFEDDVKSRLTPKTDAAGVVTFDGLARQATVKTEDNIRIHWTFSADEGTHAASTAATK